MQRTTGFGVVKEVLSGDTLVIIGQPQNGPPPEVKLNLSSLQAPKLALKPATMSSSAVSKDQEKFAWQSRMFLLDACVGKRVSFKVDYTVEAIGRQFGTVCLVGNGSSPGNSIFNTGGSESLNILVARAGWARVRVREGSDAEKSPELDQLVAASRIAEDEGKGVFTKDEKELSDSIRSVTWDFGPEEDGKESEFKKLYAKIKNSPEPAIIEYVRDGASLRALLLNSMTVVNFNLAGVQCPRIGGKDDTPQEYALEAKFFTECRLLNRRVRLVVGGVGDKFNTLFGTVEHPAGKNISVELVKNGLGLPVDWSMEYTSPAYASAIHAAVRSAKLSNLRLWKSYKPPVIPGESNYSGVISEVVSGDTIIVRVGTPEALDKAPWECEERRVSLSSIRAPRLGNKNREDQPFAYEAREFLRSKIVGKKCSVNIEYIVTPPADAVGLAAQVRKYGTVIVTLRKRRANVAVLVLEEGLATLMTHKAGSTERSEHYHNLMEARNTAESKKIGLHSPSANKNASRHIMDLNTPALAKSYLSNLQQAKSLKAIVEYIHNGARMKVFVPGHSCLLSFALSGIQCPSTARTELKGEGGKVIRQATAGEPYAKEALLFTRALVLQKEVEIVIETMDRGGTAIGQIYVVKPVKGGNGSTKKESLAVLLLQLGLARVQPYSARMSPNGDALFAEEETAKAAKLRIWENFEEDEVKAEESTQQINRASPDAPIESVPCTVCHINNGNSFFVQKTDSAGKAALAAINEAMSSIGKQYGTSKGSDGSGLIEPRKGQNCLALFHDGEAVKWFRAKVLKVENESDKQKLLIQYIDFGNEAKVEKSSVRQSSDPSIFAKEGQAIECSLSFVRAPELGQDYGEDAAFYLGDLTMGKALVAKFHGKNEFGREDVTLMSSEKGDSVNAKLLREGLGTVPRKVNAWKKEEKETLAELLKAQDEAHTNHVRMWQYGDPRVDDDEQRF